MAAESPIKEHRSKYNVLVRPSKHLRYSWNAHSDLKTQIIFLATLGSISYGYSSCIIATTLGQPSFITAMKLDVYTNAVQLIGAINGLYQAGGLLGTVYVGLTGDRLGRRWAIFSASVITVVGGALQAGSVHVGMFMAARFITGLGIGMGRFYPQFWFTADLTTL